MTSEVRDGDPVNMSAVRRRATRRKLRLHACGYLRLNAADDLSAELLELLAVAEGYADGEFGTEELLEARRRRDECQRPTAWGVDLRIAFDTDEALSYLARLKPAPGTEHHYVPTDRDYHLVLVRYRLYEELVGPNPLPAFSRAWRTDTVLALAKQMYESRDFGAMPILADALQEAGCEDAAILGHCRDASQPHVRGCWVVDLVLGRE